MEPQNLRFGGGATDTVLNPLMALVMGVALILIVCLPRKYAIAPMILGIFTVPINQVLVIGGVHFTIMRILILAGLTRWGRSRRIQPTGVFAGGFNSIDRVFALFALLYLITSSLDWMEVSAVIKGLGTFLDGLGGYFVLRLLIRDKEDIHRAIKVFAIVAFVMGICMLNEQITHHNIFGLLGGRVAERDGKFRSQGAFEVFLTAGAFGATLLPLLVWLWSDTKSRVIAYLGIAGATAMTLTSNSSTPDLAYVGGIMALCFWPFRRRLRIFRWGLVLSLIGLQLVMKAPVWALIARIDLTGSSSGTHRYMLVDNFMRHFGDWWIMGFKDYNTWGWDMWDLSNQFIAYGLGGGLITLALFITLLSRSFGGLGRARKRVAHNRSEEWFFWCLGAGLFAHVVAFFGMSYFDQMQFAFYALLAIISVAVSRVTRQPVQKTASVREFWGLEPAATPIPECSVHHASIF
jgi:hypothetical protein